MDLNRAAQELKVIRALMERPVRYSTQSGLAGILAGVAALAGLAADGYVWKHCLSFTNACEVSGAIWGGVFAVALVAVVVLTRLREKKQGMPFWSQIKLKMLKSILPPFVAGSGLTVAILVQGMTGDGQLAVAQGRLIPVIWMLFYGVACWQVGEFSIVELRVMGAAFILAGLATAAFLQSNFYWPLGATFGGLHILYGLIVWKRYGG